MVKILLSTGWAHRGQKEFNGHEGPLHDVIKEFAAKNPAYRNRLLDVHGEPLSYFNVYLDDDLVPRDQRATAVVTAGSTVAIVPPLAGG